MWVKNFTSARVSSGTHFIFAVRFFCTPVATIQCFYGIILQIGLKWNSLLFGQLARLSALYMPADILLGSCAAVEHIPFFAGDRHFFLLFTLLIS